MNIENREPYGKNLDKKISNGVKYVRADRVERKLLEGLPTIRKGKNSFQRFQEKHGIHNWYASELIVGMFND